MDPAKANAAPKKNCEPAYKIDLPMTRYVALFRGINVGKAKRIAMADLRQLLQTLGYTGVHTLLNSGNAVFDAPKETAVRHAQRIQAAVTAELGVDAFVIVKSAQDIGEAVAGNPLQDIANEPSRLLVVLTQDVKSLQSLQALAEKDWGAETLRLGTHAAYLWCGNGILESKIAVRLLKDLSDSGTTRNWATLKKIQTLMQA